MKITLGPEKLDVDIEQIYTSTDKLPADIQKPQKEPYLILEIPHTQNVEDTYDSLQNYAMGTITTLETKTKTSFLYIVTGKRIIKEVIKKLRVDNANDAEWSSGQQQRLDGFDQTILEPKYKEPTTRSVPLADIVPSSPLLVNPTGVHTVERVQYNNKNYIFKKDETGRQISEIETFNAMCYRLLLGSKSPVVFSVHDKDTRRRVGLVSEEIPNYELFINGNYRVKGDITEQKLVVGGLGSIVGAAYAEAENDFNLTNMGVGDSEKRGQKVLYIIDPGQSSYPVVSKYFGFDPQKANATLELHKPPANVFPITKKDINNLPVLSDMQAYNFLFAASKIPLNDDRLTRWNKIKNNEGFVGDKFYTLLKRILIEDSVYERLAKLCIRSEKYQKKLANHKIARTELLKNSLLTNPQFIQFYQANKQTLQEKIVADFTEYNTNTHEDEKVDIEVIKKNFDDLFSPERALADFQNQFKEAPYLTKKEQNAARRLYNTLKASSLKEEAGIIARRSCHLMDVYQRTCADIKSNEAEKDQYVENFKTYCKGYEDKLPHSLGKEVFISACTFGGALLGAVLGLVVGAAAGLTAGAIIGGGTGSVVPVFGNVVGAIGVGGVLGVASAIKAASTAAIVGTAIGAATGGALLGYGGGNAGYYLSRFGIFNTVQKATQSFSKAFQEDVKNEPKQQHRKNVPL